MTEKTEGESTASLYALGCQLCKLYSTADGDCKSSSMFDNFVTRKEKDKRQEKSLLRNKKKFFSIILKKVPIRKKCEYEMPINDKILATAFEIENFKNQKDIAKDLIDKHAHLPTDNENVNNVLKFLFKLKDSANVQRTESLVTIGSSISSYGDHGGSYPQFPAHMFQVSPGPQLAAPTSSCSAYKQFTPEMFERKLASPREQRLRPSLGMDYGPPSSPLAPIPDEGYISPGPGPQQEEQEEADIWENIMEVRGCQRMTWESCGLRTSVTEKPFLSESGPDLVHHVWSLVMDRLSLVDPSVRKVRLVPVSQEKLVLDLGYLLAAIPSSSFPPHPSSLRFQPAPGLCLASLTPECLAAFCQDFLRVGSLARQLEQFCAESSRARGHIVSGLVGGVRRFLRVYTNSVLSLSRSCSEAGTLGELRRVAAPLMEQLTFLARVCAVEEGGLPTGVALLSRLLDVSVHVSSSATNLLLTSLLSATAAPYLSFLDTWLFAGEVAGFSQEFGLEVDPRYINCRDETYWRSAYSLVPMEAGSFLADIQRAVHLAGKSLALLRLVCPHHHLAGRHRALQPRLQLAVTAEQQEELQQSCRRYEEQMLDIARESCESYAQLRAKQEEEKLRKLELVLERNRENKLRREEEAEAVREEKLRRQQKLYADLQDQAKAVKERKLKEKEDKEREDKRIEDEAAKMEDEVREREAEEKRRLEEFYAKLNHDAEMRKKRAEWKMKREDPMLKNKRLALYQRDDFTSPASVSPLTRSPPLNDNIRKTVSDHLKFELDQMGNISVMVEDEEGNIVSEVVEELSDIEESVKEMLANDNYESLPDNTKSLICDKINQRSTENSPFPNIKTRAMNKDIVLGSQIDFNYESAPSPVKSFQEFLSSPDADSDHPDGGARRRAGPDQQIERLLYPQRFSSRHEAVTSGWTRTELQLAHCHRPLEYTKTFQFSDCPLQEMGGPTKVQEPAEGGAFAPLTLILQNSVLAPLRVQARLVDRALLDQLLVGRQLVEQLAAVRNYLLLADGEFGRQLVKQLCQLGHALAPPAQLATQLYSHLRAGAPPPHLLSPAALNRVLDSALAGSVLASSDPFTKNLTFLLAEEPGTSTKKNNIGIPGLSLTYQASWPDNIVLGPDTVAKYSLILDFQLELRLAMLSLDLDWANENLVVRRDKKSTKSLLHKVNLMRHEMMHFIRNLHDYVASQVLEISWQEFQDNLLHRVTCLDQLVATHEKYLNRAIFRCLLNPKAAPVMKIVRDIFSSITKFSGLIAMRMTGDEEENGAKIEAQYKTFSQYSRYFFSLVTKLAARGYQPHLQDLLLRLNFNGFYN